jgi:hypothetical protein
LSFFNASSHLYIFFLSFLVFFSFATAIVRLEAGKIVSNSEEKRFFMKDSARATDKKNHPKLHNNDGL